MKKQTEVENSLLAMVSRSEIDLSVSEVFHLLMFIGYNIYKSKIINLVLI